MHTGINHLTLATGHSRISPRHEVNDEFLANMRKSMLRNWPPRKGGAGHVKMPEQFRSYKMAMRPQGDQHHVIAEIANSRVNSGKSPIITFGIAWSERHAARCWDVLRALHPAGLPLPGRPDAPWIGVHIDMELLIQDPELPTWAGDFERCLAWAIAPLDA